MPTFWINLIKELIWFDGEETTCNTKKTKRCVTDVFMLVVKMAMTWLFFVVLTQQLTLINTTWGIKVVQYEKAALEYVQHQCGHMKTTNVQFIAECERLSVVMRVSPLVAAITSVINSWNSCLTMPCTQLLHTISNHYEYKFLFILVSIGFFYYVWKFFTATRNKAVDWQDMLRADLTRKYKKQVMEELKTRQIA